MTTSEAKAHAFRIKVRGEFKDLTVEQREDLLAHAAEHDPLRVQWVPEGSLSYELQARPFFTFRFAATGRTDRDLERAASAAEGSARAWLDARGLAYKLGATHAEDLSRAPQAKRQRRAGG